MVNSKTGGPLTKEDIETLADEVTGELYKGNGKGGGGKKRPADATSKTVGVLRRKAHQTVEAKKRNRLGFSIRQELTAFNFYIKNNPDLAEAALQSYLHWLNSQRQGSAPLILDADIHEDRVAAIGPGGQNVQKNQTKVRLTHLPTRLTAKEGSSRVLTENQILARGTLEMRLQHHLDLWLQLQPTGEITRKILEHQQISVYQL